MIGDRILQARKAAGLSMRALGERAGISAMAISKYENGQVSPSSGVLLAIAQALGVRVEYFFRSSKVRLQQFEYRKHAKLPKKTLAQIEGDVIEQIERFVELEEFLPSSPIEPFNIPDDLPLVEEYDDVERVAQRVREVWELGASPVPDLIDTLEEKGIKVFRSKALHNEMFDGLAGRVDGSPVVVVGRDWPGDRQRFTLAHELGHLVLHGRLSQGLDEERAANRFVGAFLVPAGEVVKELGFRRKWLDPMELCILKSVYGLSMQAWLYRARDLKVITQSTFNTMLGLFRKQGWRKTEPGEPYPSEEPKLFEQLVFHACAEDLISDSKAAELLGKSIIEFRAMRNVGSCAPPIAHQ